MQKYKNNVRREKFKQDKEIVFDMPGIPYIYDDNHRADLYIFSGKYYISTTSLLNILGYRRHGGISTDDIVRAGLEYPNVFIARKGSYNNHPTTYIVIDKECFDKIKDNTTISYFNDNSKYKKLIDLIIYTNNKISNEQIHATNNFKDLFDENNKEHSLETITYKFTGKENKPKNYNEIINSLYLKDKFGMFADNVKDIIDSVLDFSEYEIEVQIPTRQIPEDYNDLKKFKECVEESLKSFGTSENIAQMAQLEKLDLEKSITYDMVSNFIKNMLLVSWKNDRKSVIESYTGSICLRLCELLNLSYKGVVQKEYSVEEYWKAFSDRNILFVLANFFIYGIKSKDYYHRYPSKTEIPFSQLIKYDYDSILFKNIYDFILKPLNLINSSENINTVIDFINEKAKQESNAWYELLNKSNTKGLLEKFEEQDRALNEQNNIVQQV